MESVQLYSSEEEEEEEEQIQEQETVQVIAQDQEEEEIYRINIYSQNYTNNIMHRSSLFMYIPWQPSITSLKTIQAASKKALLALPMANNYIWKDVNRMNQLKYHISIYPNINAEEYKLDQFKENLSHSIRNLSINKGLVGVDQDEVQRKERLNALLGSQTLPRNYVNLKFRKSLKLFPSSSKDAVFLAGVIEMDPRVSQFFEGLTEHIHTNANSVGIIGQPEKMEFHITLQIGELSNPEYVPDHDEINSILSSVDTDLDSININVSELIIWSIGARRFKSSIGFNI